MNVGWRYRDLPGFISRSLPRGSSLGDPGGNPRREIALPGTAYKLALIAYFPDYLDTE